MNLILIFVLGVLFGGAAVFIIVQITRRKSDEQLQQTRKAMEEMVKASFTDVTKQSIDQLIVVSKQMFDSRTTESAATLEEKKKLIDQSLTSLSKDMQDRLDKVQKLMTDIEKNVPEKYGQVSNAISNVNKQNEILRQTTESLRLALSGTQQRGQWGERMAEDILRFVGLVEGVNYEKQSVVSGGKTRPDFTFLLPEGLKVNMDVKFPLNKYMAYLEASDEYSRESAKKSFLMAVRGRIKEVTGREYINPDDNTVDYVLVFIPNEQVYAFIQEADSTILDEALKQKVILCSPLTLYAMLALIRQAVDNFNLRKSSGEIQALLGGFKLQWVKFIESMSNMGKRLDAARKEYDDMVGTRRNMLDRQVDRIDRLNKQQGIEPKLADDNDEPPAIEDKNLLL